MIVPMSKFMNGDGTFFYAVPEETLRRLGAKAELARQYQLRLLGRAPWYSLDRHQWAVEYTAADATRPRKPWKARTYESVADYIESHTPNPKPEFCSCQRREDGWCDQCSGSC